MHKSSHSLGKPVFRSKIPNNPHPSKTADVSKYLTMERYKSLKHPSQASNSKVGSEWDPPWKLAPYVA